MTGELPSTWLLMRTFPNHYVSMGFMHWCTFPYHYVIRGFMHWCTWQCHAKGITHIDVSNWSLFLTYVTIGFMHWCTWQCHSKEIVYIGVGNWSVFCTYLWLYAPMWWQISNKPNLCNTLAIEMDFRKGRRFQRFTFEMSFGWIFCITTFDLTELNHYLF